MATLELSKRLFAAGVFAVAVAAAPAIAVFAVPATLLRGPHRPRALLVTFGLLTCSATLVHIMNGAIEAHEAVGRITAQDDPGKTILGGLGYIRNPNNPAQNEVGAPLMPLSLGDSWQSLLSVSTIDTVSARAARAGSVTPD